MLVRSLLHGVDWMQMNGFYAWCCTTGLNVLEICAAFGLEFLVKARQRGDPPGPSLGLFSSADVQACAKIRGHPFI